MTLRPVLQPFRCRSDILSSFLRNIDTLQCVGQRGWTHGFGHLHTTREQKVVKLDRVPRKRGKGITVPGSETLFKSLGIEEIEISPVRWRDRVPNLLYCNRRTVVTYVQTGEEGWKRIVTGATFTNSHRDDLRQRDHRPRRTTVPRSETGRRSMDFQWSFCRSPPEDEPKPPKRPTPKRNSFYDV